MRCLVLGLWAMAGALAAGCTTPAERVAGAVVATAVAAHTPTSNIAQTYYLGVFDPQDQLPPQVYRIRVKGQASMLNFTKFGSGWVRAELVDSLAGRVELPSDKTEAPSATRMQAEREQRLLSGRRLIMFGPEGFREAPKDHRLVVVMGSDPEAFFSAVDQALGVVAAVTQGTNAGPAIEKLLWADLARSRLHSQRLGLIEDGLRYD